jgi:hypothetical protein
MQRSSRQHDDLDGIRRTGLIKAAIEGRLPRGIGRHRDPPRQKLTVAIPAPDLNFKTEFG